MAPSNRQRKRSNARGRSHSQLRTSTMSERVDLRSGSALRVWRVGGTGSWGGTARMGWMASQDARLQQWGAKWPMRCRAAGWAYPSLLPSPSPLSLPFPSLPPTASQPTNLPCLTERALAYCCPPSLAPVARYPTVPLSLRSGWLADTTRRLLRCLACLPACCESGTRAPNPEGPLRYYVRDSCARAVARSRRTGTRRR